jgi:3-oxoacyl-[acyl-carrier protein] reductase
MAKFEGKTMLIAGCKGVADELARLICEEGGTVIVNDPDSALTDAITAPVALKLNYGTSMEDSSAMIEEIIGKWTMDEATKTVNHESEGKFEKLDVVVMNFDEYEAAKLRTEQVTKEAYRTVMDGNVTPTFHLFAAIRDHFRAKQDSKEQASVLILGSVAGLSGLSIGSLYAAAKAAQFGMTRSMAKEFGKFANVNAIAQGFYSEKTNRPGPKDKEKKDFLSTKTALADEELTYADVAHFAAFLVSESARMISGQIMAMDGGLWLRVQA